jgi:NitT/TauT family transport system substrate-binding protein
MKKLIKATVLSSLASVSIYASNCDVTLTTSAYVNWNAINASKSAGLYDAIEKEKGCKLTIEYKPDYLQSLDFFKAKKADAVTVTNLDQMSALNMEDTTAISLQDYSNGNDGVISREGMSIKDLKGQKIWMVTKSISEQLWVLAAKKAGLDPYRDFKIQHMDLDSSLRAGYDAKKIDNIVTWNPSLSYLAKLTKAKKSISSSAQFPGAIIDMIVLRSSTKNFDQKADFLRSCWDKTAEVIATKKGTEYDDFMKMISKDMGSSVDEAEEMLSGAKIFTPKEELEFFKNRLPLLQEQTYKLANENEFFADSLSYKLIEKKGSKEIPASIFFDIR